MTHQHLIRLTAISTILLAVCLLMGEPVGSHVPITTRITFNREVVRILRQHCHDCHSPRGVMSSLPLLTYAEARPWAKAIKEEILNRRMSPHQVVKGYGLFRHDYLISAREQDQLVSWIDGGAPKGDEKDFPAGLIAEMNSPPGWSQGDPDLILQPAETTRVPPNPATFQRCLTIPVRNQRPLHVSLVDFIPDNGRAIQRASIYLTPSRNGTAPQSAKACRLAAARLTQLGEWVPGQRSSILPSGMARLLPARATILLQIEYRGVDQPTTDRSRLGIYLAKGEITHLIETGTLRGSSLSGETRIAIEEPIKETRQIVGIRPLLPSGALSLEARLLQPDGSSEVLIFARNFRFDWRPTYYFRVPRPAPAGARLSITAYTGLRPTPVLCQIILARAINPSLMSTLEDSRPSGTKQKLSE